MSDVTAEPVTQRKPLNRPSATTYNWVGAKRAWIHGETVQSISEAFGIPKASIYRKASVSKWPRRQEASAHPITSRSIIPPLTQALQTEAKAQIAIQVPVISQAIRAELSAWFKGVLGTSTKLHEQIDGALEQKVDVEEIKSLAGSLELIDRVARRTFGLDSPGSQSSGIAGLALVAQPWSGSAVIDVTPEPAQLPAVVQEAPTTPTNTP